MLCRYFLKEIPAGWEINLGYDRIVCEECMWKENIFSWLLLSVLTILTILLIIVVFFVIKLNTFMFKSS